MAHKEMGNVQLETMRKGTVVLLLVGVCVALQTRNPFHKFVSTAPFFLSNIPLNSFHVNV